MNVFIIDDDITSRTMMTAMLGKWGYETQCAEDGESAWKILEGNAPPRLILLDWSMPGLNGIDLTRRIRGMNGHSPPYIIMVTARNEKESIVAGLDAGANDYVSKPFEPEVLRARVNNGRRMIELQESLEHEASHDQLTGILNRRAIIAALGKEIARRSREGTGLVVGLCDLDHFKAVNDEYGHQAGDEALRGFVRAAGGCLREYDYFGRWGGEEFLIVLPLRSDNDAFPLFERIRASVAEGVIPTSAGNLRITVSIGIMSLSGGETVDNVIAVVDRALYKAKAEGRNRVCAAD